MTYCTWIKRLGGTVLLFGGIIMGFNYYVDPLQQFRISTLYPIYFDNALQRHLNPGLAKNYEYHSLILGTSHTKNFRLSEVEAKLSFEKAIKFSIGGASGYEESRLLRLALDRKSLKKVLYGLDVLAFAGTPRRKNAAFPEYLYDESLWSSLLYLIKFDTTLKSFRALIWPHIEKDPIKFKFDRMYEDQYVTNDKFGKTLMLQHPGYVSKNIRQYAFKVLKESFETNMLPLIKKNREVQYYIFYPPYSIVAYKKLAERGVLEEVLAFKKYMYNTLSILDNVRIYDFQTAKATTHHLDYYRDSTHYHQKVTSWILDQIELNHYRVTKENVDALNKELVKQCEAFKLPD